MNQNEVKTLSIKDFASITGVKYQSEDLNVHITGKSPEKKAVSYPFKSPNYEFIFITQGSAQVLINLIPYTLKKNQCIAYTPKTVLQILELSNDLKVISISFSNNFIMESFLNKTGMEAFDFFTINTIPKLTLSKTESSALLTLSKLLKYYNSLDDETLFKNEIIRNTFGVINYTYASIFKKEYPTLKVELSRQEELTLRFWNVLQENVRRERSVQFYAEVLCVTTGHLSKTLKQVTGKPASQLIDETIIMEAKLLLETPRLTISQIAENLNFSDQSFFGKFFKKQVGLSPSSYRTKNR